MGWITFIKNNIPVPKGMVSEKFEQFGNVIYMDKDSIIDYNRQKEILEVKKLIESI